jgi:2-desacetyl-2-hydroxyethyl bacteriochlorophyllide A dehydrogenase
MKAIVLEKPGEFRPDTVAGPPAPGTGEAILRIHRIGICGTDFHAFAGRQPFFTYPRRLGHELAVEVMEVGDAVTTVSTGDTCALLPYVNCNQCVACRSGKTNCCVNLSVLGVHADGGMCEYLTVPVRLLYRSQSLSLDQLALVEPLSIGAHAVWRAMVQRGEWALIVGAGPIGLATAQFAIAAGAEVIIADINERRLDFCRQHLGVVHCVRAGDSPLEQVTEITGGDLSTAVFDCTGNKSSMEHSFQYVAHGGRLIFVGLVQADISFHDPLFHRREMTLLATRNATGVDFQRVITALETGQVQVSPWITHRCKFDDFVEHFSSWNDPESGIIKGVVEV